MSAIANVGTSSLSYFEQHKKSYQKAIQAAFARDLFIPHKALLTFRGENWYKIIHQITLENLPQSQNKLTVCYLFSLAIDPQFSKEEKERLITQTTDLFSEDERQSFYKYLNNDIPPTMMVGILFYSSLGVLKDNTTYVLHEILMKNLFFQLFATTINSSFFSNEDKQVFLTKTFDMIPEIHWENILSYFYMIADETQVNSFEATCPEKVKGLLNYIIEEARNIKNYLRDVDTIVNIPLEGNPRKFLIKLLYENYHDLENADLILASFNNNDWYAFQKMLFDESMKSYKNDLLPNFIMDWIIKIVSRNKETPISGLFDGDSPRFFSIYNYSIRGSVDWDRIPEEKWQCLAQALDEHTLLRICVSTRCGEIISHLFKYFFSPEFLIKYCETVFESPTESVSWITGMSRLFFWLNKKGLKESAFSLIFDRADAAFTFKAFSSIYSNDLQQEIITYFLKNDRDKAVETLSKWALIYFHQGLGEKNNHFKTNFAAAFFKALKSIEDHSFVLDLKQKISLELAPEQNSSLNILLPIGASVEEMREISLQKLKEIFLTSGLSYSRQKEAISPLRNYLPNCQASSAEDFVLLFQSLPEEMWPLVFLHFEINPFQTQIIKEIGVIALLYTFDNPLVLEVDRTIRELFDHFNDKEKEQVVQGFVKAISPESFVSKINRIGDNLQEEEFSLWVKKALDSMPRDEKIEFIKNALVDCAISSSEYQLNSESFVSSELVQDPILHTSEVAEVGKLLINDPRINFLIYLYKFPNSSLIIKALEAIDYPFVEGLFFQLLDMLQSSSLRRLNKIILLRDLCNRFANAGLDPITLLCERSKEDLLEISRWYQPEVLIPQGSADYINIQIFHKLNPNKFEEFILRATELIITNSEKPLSNFEDLFSALIKFKLQYKVMQNNHFTDLLQAFFEGNFTKIFMSTKCKALIPFFCKSVKNWDDMLIKWIKSEGLPTKKTRKILNIFRSLSTSFHFGGTDLLLPFLEKAQQQDFGIYQKDFNTILEKLRQSPAYLENLSNLVANLGNTPIDISRIILQFAQEVKV
ncbi:MAG: hypothetical protein PVI40_05495 [Chlamydiota bacterium]|jgi:hypothetical protein